MLHSCRSPLNPFNTNIPSSGAQPVKKKPIIKTEPRAVPIKLEPRSLPRPNIPDPEDNFDEVDGMDMGMGPAVKQEIVEDLPQSSECQGMTSVKSIMVKMLWSETINCFKDQTWNFYILILIPNKMDFYIDRHNYLKLHRSRMFSNVFGHCVIKYIYKVKIQFWRWSSHDGSEWCRLWWRSWYQERRN